MKRVMSLFLTVAMVMSMFSTVCVQAVGMRSFNAIVYNQAENADENKGWISESSAGAVVSSDESGNVIIQSSGTGVRYASLDVADTASENISVDFSINAKLKNYMTSALYSYFTFTDSSKEDILSIKIGNETKDAQFTASVNDTAINGINSESVDSGSDVTIDANVLFNFANHTAVVTIGEDIYEVSIPETAQSISYVRCKMQRDKTDNLANSSMMTVSALKIEEINTVKIIPSENCVKNDDGTYTVTVPAEEEIAVADLINYDYDQSAPQYEVITDSTVDESSAIIEFLPRYNTVVLKGIAPNDNAGSFKIHIENADGIAETVFNVVVEESLMKPLPQIEALTPVSEESPILSIDFEGDDTTLYTYTDEYGRVTSDEVSWTSIEDTSNGLKYRSETAENPSDSGITGSAFYGWLTPENGTQKGNGYRGSRLVLDNEKVQRTDKIKVSYDFAIYNIVNVDNTGVDVGMPQVVSMTSEAVEGGSIPYDFNDQHYREPDADVSDVNGISKHLLTFATGRTKRNSEGLHRLDMTNELGYFEPRYANDETPGRYKKLQGFTLLPNEFNFFHVDSEIDFYNNVIEFTITNTQDSTQTATITTTITEHASWDGFIVSSQKWDTSNPRDDSDIDGKDTEHYIYIDNIKSEKLAEDVANIVTTAPEVRPLPEDAIAKVNAETASTWKYNKAYDLHTDVENGYVDYSSEVDNAYDFTSQLATGYSANGITSYTEFDFYLPKKGSYVTVYNRGSEGGGESYGNTLIISDAGICSWSGLEGYTPIYEENLECGKWYSLTVIYDHCGENETIILKDGDTEIANVDVYSRNLHGSYYRAVWVNRDAIPRGSDYPTFYPSMATAYVANLRVYNRGVLQEFYPYGCTVAENTDGDIINADGEDANDSRLGAYVGTFTMNQVEGDDAEITDSTAKWGAIPENPSVPEGYKFTGWKLVYQNGADASETDITVTGNSTRLKYVADAELILGKIHGTVWNDADSDGVIDDGESVVPNITVIVTDKNDPTKTYELTTDENGNYTTEDIPAVDYTVTVVTPDGYGTTTENGKTVTVTENADVENNIGINEPVGKIYGTVWNDADSDGIMNENEDKLPNVTVTVVSKLNPDNKYTLTTDENGNYGADKLPVGEYTVTVTTPDGYIATTVTETTITVTDGVESESNFGFTENPDTPAPTATPTVEPTVAPTVAPTATPTATPTVAPTVAPTTEPTVIPTIAPTAKPTAIPVATKKPYISSGGSPTLSTSKTTPKPTVAPTTVPSATTVPKETPDVSGENNVPQLNKTEHYAYIVGYPEGDVRPERHITREEVATVFFRLLTDASRTEYWMQTNGFDDVTDDRWSNNAISTMTNANVIAGYEDNTFRPWVAITRAEFAAMAARFDSGEYNGENKFSDIDGHWAAEEINRAAERGWISGYEDGTFRPNQYITRAEAMTLINKMLERIVTPDGIHKDAIFWPDNLPEMWYYTAVEEATNSHDYEKNEDGIETWTKINPPRDWEKLERAWSKADSAGHEDSVMYGE